LEYKGSGSFGGMMVNCSPIRLLLAPCGGTHHTHGCLYICRWQIWGQLSRHQGNKKRKKKLL